MNIPFSLLLDIFIAVLLIVTIGYALTLNNRLGVLRRDKDELQALALSFGESTIRAEESIAHLSETIDVLQERIKRAESLREDLVFLIDRGNSTADTLEELLRSTRDNAEIMPRTSVKDTAHKPVQNTKATKVVPELDSRIDPDFNRSDLAKDDTISDAEREHLRALRSSG